MTAAPTSRASIWSWAAFQGGRDPYVMLITIYVFVPYLVTTVIADPVQGQSLVATGHKYAGWLVMLIAPLLGATVDRMGRRKPWLVGTVAIMAMLVSALWWAMPGGAGLSISAIIALLAVLGVLFAATETLHNALLIPAAGMERAGFASGLALALGNLVSVIMLAFVMLAFALPGKVDWAFVPAQPLFGLDATRHETERVVAPIVAILLLLGLLPLLRFVPDVPATGVRFRRALRMGFADLKSLFAEARGYRNALTYLGARMLFTDGLTGVLIFAGVYAAGVMGWRSLELLAYGMLLSIFSVFGGLAAGWLDAKIGPKLALQLEIAGVIVSQLLSLGNTPTSLLYMTYDRTAHVPFWAGPIFRTAPELALLACGFVGAVTVTAAYSSSRTMLTRVVPPDKVGVFFGLFVIAGTATMWVGPLLVELATNASGSQRLGLLPISGLLLAGLVALRFVKGGQRG